MITSATITITVDDTKKTINFVVSGDEGRAKKVATQVLYMIDAETPGDSFELNENYLVQ